MRLRLHRLGAGLGIVLGLVLAPSSHAQPAARPTAVEPDDATSAEVGALNRQIAARNAAILQGNADRQAAWEKERAMIAADNARLKAAFAAQQAAHEADMAKWRADTAALARATPAGSGASARLPSGTRARLPRNDAATDADPTKRVCHMESQTGSMIKRTKVCLTVRETDERARDAQAMLRGMGTNGCGKASCN